MIISNKINKKIKDFVSRKNNILKKLDDFLIKFNNKNINIFFNFSKKIINNMKGQDLFYKNIYLNKMFFFFIFLLPKNNIINIDKIKHTIRNIEKGISFEIIQKEDINEIENYIRSQKMDKLRIKIIISNDEDQIRIFASIYSNENNDYCYYNLKNKKVDINLTDIIKNNFSIALNLFFNDFYQTKKYFLPNIKENKEILSRQNLLEKIKYDMKLMKIKYDMTDSFPIYFSLKLEDNKEENKEIQNIVNEYYSTIVNMIKELLDLSKIKNDNNIINFFINKVKFVGVLNSLIENLKCKCFYRYFLFNYIKNMTLLDLQINLDKIVLDEIM